MCHPAVAIAFSTLQAVAQEQGERRQAKATFNYQVDKQRQTIAIAADAARTQYQGLEAQRQQAHSSAALDVSAAFNEYRRAASSSRVARSAAGVAGLSAAEEDQEFARKYAVGRAHRMMNLSAENTQLLVGKKKIFAQQKGRVAASRITPIAQPATATTLFRIGGGIMDAYSATPEHSFWSYGT